MENSGGLYQHQSLMPQLEPQPLIPLGGAIVHPSSDSEEGANPAYTGTIQMAVPEPEIFWGIPLRNPRKAMLVKRVMHLAVFLAAVQIAHFIWLVLIDVEGDNDILTSAVNTIILLSIPYCGWRGAKDNDSSLLAWFCGCNLACACYWPLLAILMQDHMNKLSRICEECQEETARIDEESETLHEYDYDQSNHYSDDWTLEVETCFFEKSRTTIDVDRCSTAYHEHLQTLRNELLFVQVPIGVINFITFYWGNQLYRYDEKVDIDVPYPNSRPDMPQMVEAAVTIATLPQQNPQSMGQPSQPQPPQSDMTATTSTSVNSPTTDVPSKPLETDNPTYAALPFAGTVSAIPASTYNVENYDNAIRVHNQPVFTTAASFGNESSASGNSSSQGGP